MIAEIQGRTESGAGERKMAVYLIRYLHYGQAHKTTLGLYKYLEMVLFITNQVFVMQNGRMRHLKDADEIADRKKHDIYSDHA